MSEVPFCRGFLVPLNQLNPLILSIFSKYLCRKIAIYLNKLSMLCNATASHQNRDAGLEVVKLFGNSEQFTHSFSVVFGSLLGK